MTDDMDRHRGSTRALSIYVGHHEIFDLFNFRKFNFRHRLGYEN